MARLSEWYGRLLDALVVAACALLLLMTVIIGLDVLSRNIGGGGVAVSNELSEDILYFMTLLVAPWLLRQGQHIRVDIILRTLPLRTAWLLEWLGDIVGFICCLYFVWYGLLVTVTSYSAGSINIKTLVTPEWWTLAPLPLGFTLLAIEFIFRMHRLASADIGLRDDAVSAA
ncbi:MAG TPA: TRAP transporter small permease subunit [Pseudolabrys sp.]|nr:TRAP transporter small permease subunit [Pseudolabrys sp.]